jgi:F0F1-type ATP synthase epsilon subunit
VVQAGAVTRRFAVDGGFLQTINNTVRIVAEQVKGVGDAP